MSDSQSPAARREAAAGWYAELQDEHLAEDVWRRFLAWERDPRNAAGAPPWQRPPDAAPQIAAAFRAADS